MKGVKTRNNIYEELVRQEKTQAWLARKVQVKREYINRIINNKVRPAVGLALKIAKALGCSVEDLFEVV